MRPATARGTASDCFFSCSLGKQAPSRPWSGDAQSPPGVAQKSARQPFADAGSCLQARQLMGAAYLFIQTIVRVNWCAGSKTEVIWRFSGQIGSIADLETCVKLPGCRPLKFTMRIREGGRELRCSENSASNRFKEIDMRKQRTAWIRVGVQNPNNFVQITTHNSNWF